MKAKLLLLALLPLAFACSDDDLPDTDCKLVYFQDEYRSFIQFKTGSWWHYVCEETGDTIRLEIVSGYTNTPPTSFTGQPCTTQFSNKSKLEYTKSNIQLSGFLLSGGYFQAYADADGCSTFSFILIRSQVTECSIADSTILHTRKCPWVQDAINSYWMDGATRYGVTWDKNRIVSYNGDTVENSWFIECPVESAVAINRIYWSRTEGIVQFDVCELTFRLQNHHIIN